MGWGKSKPIIGPGLERTFTRTRHGTLKGNCEDKNAYEVVIDRAR